jgi:oxygen-dependent protoporphyrinogen oxidase
MTPEIQEIVTDLGLEDELVQASSRSNARYIFRRGKLRKLTSNPASIFISPLLSWKAKFRLLRESKVKTKSPKGESVAGFVSRRFGREMYESVANPVLSGIYAGDPEKMEAAIVLKQFLKYEEKFGSIIKGLKANKGKNKRVISSFRKGTGVLLDALYKSVKENCISEKEATGIVKIENGYEIKTADGSSYKAERVISCLPSYISAELLNQLDSAFSSELDSIPYCQMEMTHLCYKKSEVKENIEGFGFLVPEIEGKPLLGAVINSSAFEARAADDEMTFTIFSKPDRGQSSELAQQEIEKWLKISALPNFRTVTRWERAIPQFEIGHAEILLSIAEFEAKENIYISGNFRSGVSVGDCVKFAKEISM